MRATRIPTQAAAVGIARVFVIAPLALSYLSLLSLPSENEYISKRAFPNLSARSNFVRLLTNTLTGKRQRSVMNWDNFHLFLAVATEGSIRKAAASLGMSHATLSRKLSAFEQAFGVALLERR